MEFYRSLCFLFFLSGQLLLNLPFSTAQLCRPVQSDALLQFNNSLTIETDTDSNCDPKMTTWKNGLDCCSWDGVTCDNVTGNIIGLNLSFSCLQGTLHSNSSLFALRHLQSLNLASNNFRTSPILPELSVFVELRHLNLSYSNFLGLVPVEISFLSKLVLLDLSQNYEYDDLIGMQRLKIENTSFKILVQNLTKLRELNLDLIDMSAVLLSSFMNLSSSLTFFSANLKTLNLSNCTLTGSIPSSLVNLSKLTILDLSCNELTGHIPSFVVKLEQLMYVDLSFNNFTGVLDLGVFSTLKNLQALHLTVELNLMYNKYFLHMLNLWIVDLSNNKFKGPLPIPPPTTQFYFSANNKIGGKVSPLICNATELRVLDLSNNSLMGTLPECLMSFSKNLSVLNLRMNMIHGVIPRKFAEDNKLRTIDLSRNRFEGTLPWSLLHCENLEVLDLGNNRMKDTFPDWLGTLPKLQVLVLRSNMFHGFVSSHREAHSFSKLRIFDLSNNNLSGPLPVIMVTMKGLEIRLVKILTVFTSIDLSSNHFGGKLPVYIGNLKSLKGLNFSHNNLTGYIPSNKFIGSIPQELADLTSLAFLNLSENQLIGPIPQGRQFNTFKSDSFAMNPRLCGFPWSKTCTNNPREIPPVTILRENDTGHGGWFEWRAILMGYGCGTVGGVSLGYVVLGSRKFEWLAGLLERKGANMRK
ncbi:hypothetical protein EUGRSUZ_F00522, partial [Eucalyptus grandis]